MIEGGLGQLVSEEAQKRRFHSLDGARGIAALAVVTVHWQTLLRPVNFAGGQRAVDLFFMISGFVIALKYDARLHHDLTASRFFLKRFARLWPLHLLGTASAVLGIAASLLAHTNTTWTWTLLAVVAASNLIMLPSIPSVTTQYSLFPLNNPSWSLFWEIAVNYVYALTRKWLSNQVITMVVIVSATALLASDYYYGNLAGGFGWKTVPQGLPRVVFGFFAGVLLYRWHAARRLNWLRVPVFLPLMAVLAVLYVPAIAGSRGFADGIFVVGLLPVIVAALIENEPKRGIKLCAFLGLISYPLYALHYVVGKYTERLIENFAHRQPIEFAPVIGIALLAGLLVACALVEWIYDRPFRRRMEQMVRSV